jgi:hypothetical protein
VDRRRYGHAIARAYACHQSKDDTTSVYTKANLPEVATALSALTGEPHPPRQTTHRPIELTRT